MAHAPQVQKTVEHVLREFKQRPYGDRALVASEDAAPPPPPPAARVNRFSAHAPGNPPGPPAVPTIKPAWITAKEFPQQQPQQQHQQQLLPPPWPQPPQLPLPQQPQMQRPPGSANGFSHNPPPPPPPPQQPVPVRIHHAATFYLHSPSLPAPLLGVYNVSSNATGPIQEETPVAMYDATAKRSCSG